MKVSLVTVSWNNADVIKNCLDSVASQDHPELEYIIIDGASKDGTQDIIKSYNGLTNHFVSEPDKGIYDAMNKGLKLASGEVIGLINADDFLVHEHVISRVVREFEEKEVDAIFGDVEYVDPDDLDRVVRYYPGKGFKPAMMKQGNMPPHPSFYVKRELYERFGLFDTQFRITADFEFMVRLFLKGGISYSYIPETLVKMRTGGASTSGLKSMLNINREMLVSLRQNGISSNYLHLYSRYFKKIFQLIKRPD
ncbi:MAG: glycosyltransferase [Bacteroidia bacterium]|nr:glycosyltransferase [Bacteroidia bacterium]